MQAHQATWQVIQFMFSVMQVLQERQVWRVNRATLFLSRTLLSSYSDKEFKRRCRVNRSTFYYLCSVLAPSLQKSPRGGSIPLENRVALCLNRLGTGNYMLACADLFGMSEGLASIVMRQFCEAVMVRVKPLVVPTYSKENLRLLAAKFESKHGIPWIMGAIDGSHIPIVAPHGDPTDYYCRKGFYSALLQGIVDTECIFWDWDFGWAGSLHDYSVFTSSLEGKKHMIGDYTPFKLIGDAAYPTCTYMYVPFKGGKEALSPARAHWNFIQSSTRMCVERAFGVLKGRWRILLRRIEVSTDNLCNLVGACICLHNLCIMHKDFVDDTLVEEAQKWLHQQSIQHFGDLRHEGTMRILDYGKSEMRRVRIDVEEVLREASLTADEEHRGVSVSDSQATGDLQAGVTMHRQLAKILYHRHLRATDAQFREMAEEELVSSSDNEE